MKKYIAYFISYTDMWGNRHERVPFLSCEGGDMDDEFYDYYGYWPEDFEIHYCEEVPISIPLIGKEAEEAQKREKEAYL